MNSFDPERNSQPFGAETPADQSVYAESAPAPSAENPPAEAGGPARVPLFRWRDLAYLLGFYLAAGLALTQLAAVGVVIFLSITRETLQESASARVAVIAISQALLSGATLGFLYLMVRGRSTAPFWPALGWRALPEAASRSAQVTRFMLTGAGLAIVIQIASHYLGTESAVPMEELFRNRSSVLMMMALGILVAPLIEETLFRGFIYPLVARTFGVPAGIFLTGALFGLAHSLQLAGAWKQVVLLMAVGIFLTYVRARAGTVLASYCVHLGYNTLLFGVFYFVTGGLRYFPNP